MRYFAWIDISAALECNRYWEARVPLGIYHQRTHFSSRRKDNMQTTNETSNSFRKQSLA